MALRTGNLESELIDTVCARVRERLSPERAGGCESFVRQYYHWVAPDELADRSQADLYGAAIAHWNLAQHRVAGIDNIRVYNPDPDRDGWESAHTVIEIVTDDMPFIVDSLSMALRRGGYGVDLVIHPVIRVRRDDDGQLIEVLEADAAAPDAIAESVLQAEVTRERDPARLAHLRENVGRTLTEVRAAVTDWSAMRGRALALAEEFDEHRPPVDVGELDEVKAFLEWLADDHFTFLGYREYELVSDDNRSGLRVVPGTGLGILRAAPAQPFKELRPKAVSLARAPHLLVLTKANSRATIHRPVYLDYVGVKKFGAGGEVIGERRFLGLYATAAYRGSAREIPLLREKVRSLLDRAGFPPDSHDSKALVEILESSPRDALFQIDGDDLFDLAMGVLELGERPRVRLFAWSDPLDRFVSCLVTIPRDRFNTENRERAERILVEGFGAGHLDWTVQLSESVLARVHYTLHCPDGLESPDEVREIEARLARATRAWTDDLRDALIEEHGEERGLTLHERYGEAFPPGYRSDVDAGSAVADIDRIEELTPTDGPLIDLYTPSGGDGGLLRCKLFSSTELWLSDVLPTFEHMGAEVVDERPYEVMPKAGNRLWIYDFGLRGDAEHVDRAGHIFREAFLAARRRQIEDDALNGLVLKAALTAREITIVRATAKYLRQAGIAYSDAYMERTLLGHPDIARLVVKAFTARFDPERPDPDLAERLGRAVELAIDGVPSLDEDRILRSFLAVLRAVLRTSYFRGAAADELPPYVSFKLDPSLISILPLPRPRFEIFVYSPRFEGVHLRGGKVARGGLRWSDRPEDFRTEILALMKAQMVKNALIVPVGAKGGFVLKRPPSSDAREALLEEAIACYKLFLGGLLDLTDNIVGNQVVAPERVVRYDDDDPYLVVAADKGTATFSDIANEVSGEYGFWLGDAFASGGSRGYDHKQMGITARGAWESVTRHFRELGTDVQSADFSVVGIGDMSGDVFGNGMLCSRHIKLLAAFNQAHVFLDPDPDPEISYRERKRLFELPRSSWSDYDRSLISSGGGVFERTAKSIAVTSPVKLALGIDADELTPAELIRALLRAPVDLLWNGGIGTYVKAASETHAEAADKANDALRVDGRELRCRVVGEGGNLGFTQRGRIEYALRGGPRSVGGAINTDAIDNVAGVNTSDHEVNIKILLGGLVDDGELTLPQRDELLAEMTGAVADQVLDASYTQTQAISLALAQAVPMVDVHARLIRHLEQVAGLDRELEVLPSEDEIAARKASHSGLIAPELAIVMAYCKIHLFARLLESDLPEDPYLAHDLERYFPPPLPDRYSSRMRTHRLRREIVATVVANQLVDRAGTTFAFRLEDETGAASPLIARAYTVAREVFEMRSFWAAVEALDNEIDAHTQLEMLIDGRRLVERATRWLLNANPRGLAVEATIRRFEPGAEMLAVAISDVLDGPDRDALRSRMDELRAAGVPAELTARVATMPFMLPAFDIVEVAAATTRDFDVVMRTYLGLGSRLELGWLRDRITELPRANRWQALARVALRDELAELQRALTSSALEAGGPGADSEAATDAFTHRHAAAIERCLAMLDEIKASRIYDTTTLPVALRAVRNLTQE